MSVCIILESVDTNVFVLLAYINKCAYSTVCVCFMFTSLFVIVQGDAG